MRILLFNAVQYSKDAKSARIADNIIIRSVQDTMDGQRLSNLLYLLLPNILYYYCCAILHTVAVIEIDDDLNSV